MTITINQLTTDQFEDILQIGIENFNAYVKFELNSSEDNISQSAWDEHQTVIDKYLDMVDKYEKICSGITYPIQGAFNLANAEAKHYNNGSVDSFIEYFIAHFNEYAKTNFEPPRTSYVMK